jgi:hypothetical protein
MAQPVATATATATTVQSLEVALQSNLQLQAEVARRLQNLARRKAENRRLASRIQAQMVDTWDEIDVLRTPPPPLEPKVRAKPRTQNNQVVGMTGVMKKYTAKWNHDPFRKWTRRFFVDPDGSVPAPNEDMIKRRRLEEGKFFYHTCPPWSNKEIETLLAITTEILAKKKDNDNADSSCLDFAQVARTLEERTKSVDRLKCPTTRPRSADDCRLKYAEMRRENPPFTKDELMKILEQVHLHNGNPPWQDVATLLNRTATAWQCLLAYQTKLTSSRSSPWTREEDEVLLKYVAAMGPQWVLTLGSAADLSAHVLPNRTPKQILARANTTLVNPNLTHGIWSDEEERKLVLCMKVYRDTPNPIMRAAVSAIVALCYPDCPDISYIH